MGIEAAPVEAIVGLIAKTGHPMFTMPPSSLSIENTELVDVHVGVEGLIDTVACAACEPASAASMPMSNERMAVRMGTSRLMN